MAYKCAIYFYPSGTWMKNELVLFSKQLEIPNYNLHSWIFFLSPTLQTQPYKQAVGPGILQTFSICDVNHYLKNGKKLSRVCLAISEVHACIQNLFAISSLLISFFLCALWPKRLLFPGKSGIFYPKNDWLHFL